MTLMKNMNLMKTLNKAQALFSAAKEVLTKQEIK